MMTTKGLVLSGINQQKELVEIIELPDHPWFLACQFHPEFKSKPLVPHPLLFRAFIGASPDTPQQTLYHSNKSE